MIEELTCFLDFLILAWLIGTWFYEGHHRLCKVEVVCPHCKREHDIPCTANKETHSE